MSDEQMLLEHTKGWNDFVKLTAISTGFVALILILLATFVV